MDVFAKNLTCTSCKGSRMTTQSLSPISLSAQQLSRNGAGYSPDTQVFVGGTACWLKESPRRPLPTSITHKFEQRPRCNQSVPIVMRPSRVGRSC